MKPKTIDPTQVDRCTVLVDYKNIERLMRGSGSTKYAELVGGITDRGVELVVKVVVFNLPESVGQ